jgi:ethanolamine utilization microcompartment shell protein EutL
VGVPHVLLRCVVDGGRYVTKVVGAVPVIVVLGLLVAVPPEMLAVVPGALVPSSVQVVTKVNTVLEVAVAVVLINSGV